MLRVRRLLVLSLSLLLAARPGGAREWCAGLTSTAVGSGIQAQTVNPSGEEMDIFSIVVDTYGLASGSTKEPGVRLSYTHDYVLASLQGENFLMRFHAGAGLMAGYVHDHEGGFFISSGEPLKNEMGVAAALSCSIGLKFDFKRPVSIDFGFTANPGVHLRPDPENGAMYLSFYKNGIFHAILPHINIMYRF